MSSMLRDAEEIALEEVFGLKAVDVRFRSYHSPEDIYYKWDREYFVWSPADKEFALFDPENCRELASEIFRKIVGRSDRHMVLATEALRRYTGVKEIRVEDLVELSTPVQLLYAGATTLFELRDFRPNPRTHRIVKDNIEFEGSEGTFGDPE